MNNMIGALRGCLAAGFYNYNNLLSSIHTILVINLWCVRLNIKRKYYYIYMQNWLADLTQWIHMTSAALLHNFGLSQHKNIRNKYFDFRLYLWMNDFRFL